MREFLNLLRGSFQAIEEYIRREAGCLEGRLNIAGGVLLLTFAGVYVLAEALIVALLKVILDRDPEWVEGLPAVFFIILAGYFLLSIRLCVQRPPK